MRRARRPQHVALASERLDDVAVGVAPPQSSPAITSIQPVTPLDKPAPLDKPVKDAPEKPHDFADLPAAVIILVKPAMEGDPLAQFQLGKWYYEAGQLEKAKEWLTKSAVLFPPAQKLLAEVEKKISAQK